MNTIASSQKNRRERIADAMRIVWKKTEDETCEDAYSADLWCQLMCAIDFKRAHPESETSIYFGGKLHLPTLTQLEDLCELVRQSYHKQQEAKALR